MRAASSIAPARSIYARYRQIAEPDFPLPEDGYPGEYLVPIARAIRERDGEKWASAPEGRGCRTSELRTRRARRPAAAHGRRFGVAFDRLAERTRMHEQGRVKALERLRRAGADLRARRRAVLPHHGFGDDKDRVLVRGDGGRRTSAPTSPTTTKLQRADRAIDILGPTITATSALGGLAAALGYPGHSRCSSRSRSRSCAAASPSR